MSLSLKTGISKKLMDAELLRANMILDSYDNSKAYANQKHPGHLLTRTDSLKGGKKAGELSKKKAHSYYDLVLEDIVKGARPQDLVGKKYSGKVLTITTLNRAVRHGKEKGIIEEKLLQNRRIDADKKELHKFYQKIIDEYDKMKEPSEIVGTEIEGRIVKYDTFNDAIGYGRKAGTIKRAKYDRYAYYRQIVDLYKQGWGYKDIIGYGIETTDGRVRAVSKAVFDEALRWGRKEGLLEATELTEWQEELHENATYFYMAIVDEIKAGKRFSEIVDTMLYDEIRRKERKVTSTTYYRAKRWAQEEGIL